MTNLIIKIKLDNANFFEKLDRITEYSSKYILISRILSENTKGNYTEKYGSLLKLKNHVTMYYIRIRYIKTPSAIEKIIPTYTY